MVCLCIIPIADLTSRLSDQAQRQLQDSEKFEDILLGASRPTIVIQRYEELYSQARLEALDAIEAIELKEIKRKGTTASTTVMDANDMFKVQLMLEVLKVISVDIDSYVIIITRGF